METCMAAYMSVVYLPETVVCIVIIMYNNIGNSPA